MGYDGQEHRKYPRIVHPFVVSYRVVEGDSPRDISQTKNISLGGMCLTTNREFDVGTQLALEIRLPIDPHPLLLIGKVCGCKKVVQGLIYDTRIEFVDIDERHRMLFEKLSDHH